jgi:5-oxoprolinase (ATP-hydrolysing)
MDALSQEAVSHLTERGFPFDTITVARLLNLRFQGTDVALMVAADCIEDYRGAFLQLYERDFGFVLKDRAIIVDDLRSVPPSHASPYSSSVGNEEAWEIRA